MAEPGEDWHNLSDAATRRRIQNRIAQRNYRRNMRKRLKELEEQLSARSDLTRSHDVQTSHAVATRSKNTLNDTSALMSPPPVYPVSSKKRKLHHKRLREAPSGSANAERDVGVGSAFISMGSAGSSGSSRDMIEAITPSDEFSLFDPNTPWAFSTPFPTPNETQDHIVTQTLEWPQMDRFEPSSDMLPTHDIYTSPEEHLANDILYSPPLATTYLYNTNDYAHPISPQTTPTSSIGSTSSSAETSSTGQTTLHLAARKGYLSIITMLLAHSTATINDTDILGQTALHLAVTAGHDAAVDLLIDHGADIHTIDVSGRSALHLAAAQGHQSIVKVLLDKMNEGEKDALDTLGRTPLHLAIEGGWEDVVRLLLEKGADPLARISGEWMVGPEKEDESREV